MKEELRITKNRAKSEILKLPISNASYNRSTLLNYVNDQNNNDIEEILKKEEEAKEKNKQLKSELETEINKIEENARGYLNNKKSTLLTETENDTQNKNNSRGDRLLELKEESKRIKEKSEQFKNKIEEYFPVLQSNNSQNDISTNKYNEILKNNFLNNANGDNESKLNNLLTNLERVNDAYKEVNSYYKENIKDNNKIPNDIKIKLRDLVSNISTNNSQQNQNNIFNSLDKFIDVLKTSINPENILSQMKRNVEYYNAKMDAQAEIDKLENGQKENLKNELNSKTEVNAASTQAFKDIKTKATNLRNKLEEAKREIEKINSSASKIKDDLKSQLNATRVETNEPNSTDTVDSDSARGLIEKAKKIKDKVDEVVSAIDNVNTPEIKNHLKDRLNKVESTVSGTTKTISELEAIKSEAEAQKQREIARRSDYEMWWNYLTEESKKNEKLLSYKNTIESNTATSREITDAYEKLKKYVTDKRDKAKKIINNIFSTNNDYQAKKDKANKANSSEAETNEVIEYVENILRNKKAELDNKLKTNLLDDLTKQNYNVNKDFSQVTEQELINKTNEISKLLDKLQLATELKNSIEDNDKKSEFSNKISEPKTIDKLNQIILNIKKYKNEIEIQKIPLHNTKHRKFKQKLSEADFSLLSFDEKFDKLTELEKELKNYYALISFVPTKETSYTNVFLINWNNEDVTGFIKLNKVEGNFKNNYLYILAVSQDGNSQILSEAIMFNENTLKFRFKKDKITKSGTYELSKIVVSNNSNLTNIGEISNLHFIDIDGASRGNIKYKHFEDFENSNEKNKTMSPKNSNNIIANNITTNWRYDKNYDFDITKTSFTDLINKSAHTNVTINGFTVNDLDIKKNYLSVELTGEAQTGLIHAYGYGLTNEENKQKRQKYENEWKQKGLREGEYSVNYKDLVDKKTIINTEDNAITINDNNIILNFSSDSFKVGYKYNVDRIIFKAKPKNSSEDYQEYIWDQKQNTINDKKTVFLSSSYDYVKNTSEIQSYLFNANKKSQKKVFEIVNKLNYNRDSRDSSAVYRSENNNNFVGGEYITRLAFDHVKMSEISKLFNYLNSEVPHTMDVYDHYESFEIGSPNALDNWAKLHTKSKYNLREKWIEFLSSSIGEIFSKFLDTPDGNYDRGYYIKIPNDLTKHTSLDYGKHFRGYSTSSIQLGKISKNNHLVYGQDKAYDPENRRGSKLLPILGGKRLLGYISNDVNSSAKASEFLTSDQVDSKNVPQYALHLSDGLNDKYGFTDIYNRIKKDTNSDYNYFWYARQNNRALVWASSFITVRHALELILDYNEPNFDETDY